MNLDVILHEDSRRMILWLLFYDSDYTLGDDILYRGFELYNKPITRDQLAEALSWLDEKAYITLSTEHGITHATLTDRGLEIAKGTARVPGVRDLRPSEIHELQAARRS